MDKIEDPSWTNYPKTILTFPGGMRIDLRETLSDEQRAFLARDFLQTPFAIISAANPKGQSESEEANAAAVQVLKREITQRKFSFAMITGESVDGTHSETSFAVHLSILDARRLALDTDQSAYFWYDGQSFWLVGARVDTPSIKLPIK